MEITDELINKLAGLSKLSFGEAEKDAIRGDLQKMLDFVDHLKQIDVDGVEPLIHMTSEINRLRADKFEQALQVDQVLKNAPERKNSFFSVPKTVKK